MELYNVNRIKAIRLHLSKKQEVERMYFGPYEPEWYDNKGRVDNGYRVIAQRTGLSVPLIIHLVENMIKRRQITKLPVYLGYDKDYPDYVIVTLESKMNYEPENS